jgi:hypothetical protein
MLGGVVLDALARKASTVELEACPGGYYQTPVNARYTYGGVKAQANKGERLGYG